MLGVKVNWKAVKNTPMAATLVAMQAEQEAGLAMFIRMAGHSREGPCAVCAQYFGMVHDKSGRTVPLVKLHRHCVCRDVNHKLARDLGKVPVEPMKQFEWIDKVPVGTQKALLGKARSALLTQAEDKLGALKQMVGRAKLKKIDTLTAILKDNSVKELRVMGLRQGMKASALHGVEKETLIKRVLTASKHPAPPQLPIRVAKVPKVAKPSKLAKAVVPETEQISGIEAWAESNLKTKMAYQKVESVSYAKTVTTQVAELEKTVLKSNLPSKVKFGFERGTPDTYIAYAKGNTVYMPKNSPLAKVKSMNKACMKQNGQPWIASDSIEGSYLHEVGHVVDNKVGGDLAHALGTKISKADLNKLKNLSGYSRRNIGVFEKEIAGRKKYIEEIGGTFRASAFETESLGEVWAEAFAAVLDPTGTRSKFVPASVKKMIAEVTSKGI